MSPAIKKWKIDDIGAVKTKAAPKAKDAIPLDILSIPKIILKISALFNLEDMCFNLVNPRHIINITRSNQQITIADIKN